MEKVIDLIAESVQRRTRHITKENIDILKKFLQVVLENAHQVGALTEDGNDLSDKGIKISLTIASYLNRNVVVNGEIFQLQGFLDNNKTTIIEKIDEALGRKPRTISAPPAPISEAKSVVEPTAASSSTSDQVITPPLVLAPSPPVTIIGNIFRRFTGPLSSSAPTAVPAQPNTSAQSTESPATDIQAARRLERAGYFR